MEVFLHYIKISPTIGDTYDVLGLAIDSVRSKINAEIGKRIADKTMIEIACLNLTELKQQLELLDLLQKYKNQEDNEHNTNNGMPF